MELCCDLELDVNGEEIFMVDKRIICLYSGKLRKLFGKSTGSLKVFFNDFPGGAYSFEFISRFCYNNGGIEITPLNVSILHCAAHFMEMNELIELTEKSLEEINCWTWSELLSALKQCQESFFISKSSGLIEKCLDSLVGRQILGNEMSPCPSTFSPDSSAFRLSCDTRSTESLKFSLSRVIWWFEDLKFFNPKLVEMLIKSMVSRKLDHTIISRFLLYYQKSKFVGATSDEKREISEAVIDMLYTLDWSFVTCRSLFAIFQVALNLNIDKCCKHKLESMIGSHMDEATLDNLLVQSPYGKNCLYDVDLVLRFLKSFLREDASKVSSIRLRKVCRLMDLYLAEVAPDPCLKFSKFHALATALPDSARESYDGVYYAINMYLEVHAGLSDEEKAKICNVLHYDKLSSEVCIHLARNTNFPSRNAVKALISQQCKLKSFLGVQDTVPSPARLLTENPISLPNIGFMGREAESNDQIVLYATGTPNHSADTNKLRENLRGMQWKVMELEKICKKMQTQMAKIMKSKSSPNRNNSRSLPRLCS